MSQDPPFPERHARRLSRPDSPPPSEENRTTPFPKLSRYSNPQKIGEGNMGLVFKATDPRLDREIAVKILRPNHKNDPLLHKKFQNEARSLGQLDHPHIIPIFDMGQTGESLPFFTMKKVEGKTLAEHLATLRLNQKTTSHRYDGTRLLYLFLKVCEALSFAHFQGLIHRDLKPENIMLGPFGEVLITDWGLARQIQPTPEKGESETSPHTHSEEFPLSNDPWVTQEGQIVGTPMYMSPEQARGENHRVGPRSDIYSLGCVLYEILTLSPPYEGKNVIQILAESTEGNIVPPTQKAPDALIPKELEEVVLKALSHDPADRYQSVSTFIEDLRAFLDDRPMASVSYSFFDRLRQWIRSHRTVAQAVGISALLTLSIFLFFTWKDWNLHRKTLEQARQKTRPLLVKDPSPSIQQLLQASVQVDKLLYLDPQNAEGIRLRQQVGKRLGQRALEIGHHLLARAAFEQLGSTGMPPEKVRPLLQMVEASKREKQRHAHQRIRHILKELRLGLSRPGRAPGAPLLEDYINNGLSLIDTQSTPILIQDLAELTAKSHTDSEGAVWTQEERDRSSFHSRLLSRIASRSAVEALSEWLRELRDPQMILETSRALCNSRNPAALPALEKIRSRLGSDSELWKSIQVFLPRLEALPEKSPLNPERSH